MKSPSAGPEGVRPAPAVERTKLVAAIPAFNEERNLAKVISAAKKYVDEVVVVDDGSLDGTARVAEVAGAHVLRHPVNQGYGAAIRTCLSYARNNGTKVLVTLDGDGQHRAEQIPGVVAPVSSGKADISIGSRFLDDKSRLQIPRYRRLGIAFLTRLTNLRANQAEGLTDGQSGFRAYSRRAIEAIDPSEADMGAGAEILLKANRHGLQIAEVPIEVDYSVGTPTRDPVSHGITVLRAIIRDLEVGRGLSFVSFAGIQVLLLGTFIAAVTWLDYQQIGRTPPLAAAASVAVIATGVVLGLTQTFDRFRAGRNGQRAGRTRP